LEQILQNIKKSIQKNNIKSPTTITATKVKSPKIITPVITTPKIEKDEVQIPIVNERTPLLGNSVHEKENED